MMKIDCFDLLTDGITSGKRDFVIHTGSKGVEMFRPSFEIRNCIDSVDFLFENCIIDSIQKQSLVEQLECKDDESIDLAIMIIKIKMEEYGTTVRRQKSQIQ